VIRQQRHYGARVIIATQEPKIDPRLIDLCSMTIIHRFTSPEWFHVLRKHVSVDEKEETVRALFERIMGLRTGEALVFASSAIIGGKKLGMEVLKMRVRKRVTCDVSSSTPIRNNMILTTLTGWIFGDGRQHLVKVGVRVGQFL
jgi:DNA helicase HerA-like ATPase